VLYIKKQIFYIIGFKKVNKIKNFIIDLYSFFYFKKLFYNLEQDLKYNEKVINKIGLNLSSIKRKLKSKKLDYHVFCGFKKSKKNILEIGTYEGQFTNFVSNIFPESKIISIDLKKNDDDFLSSYNRSSKNIFKQHLKIRRKNLNKKNIFFYELNSFNLLDKFKNKKFDIIWIDGNHINPQVSFDIFSSIKLLKKNGILLCDDIIKDNIQNTLISNESFNTLEYLSKIKILRNNYLIKRINKKNCKLKKYISYSTKI